MMRKVREKIMSALVVLCMILACTNSIVAKEVTISGFVEQLDIADETTLSNYFQNEVSTPMRCIAPMDVVSKAELRSENTRKKL